MSKQRHATGLVIGGLAVIAVCYGFGRYAYGLFVPELQAAFGLSPLGIGVVGGISHLGYALGLIAAPGVAWARPAAAAAGSSAVAGAGMVVIAASTNGITLGIGVLVAGVGSGIASPALALLVTRRLRQHVRSPAQTWINSGTSVGLALSAPTVLFAVGWRITWALFALLALITAFLAFRSFGKPDENERSGPVGRDRKAGTHRPARHPASHVNRRLLATGALIGATSAVYWTFSRQQALDAGAGEAWSVGFWAMIGACGLAGGLAGTLGNRIGLRAAMRMLWTMWILALGMLAWSGLPAIATLASAGAFGMAYMALTGLVVVWAAEDRRDNPAGAVSTSFLALGVGQAVGTPVAGAIASAVNLPTAFALAALASLTAFLVLPRVRNDLRARSVSKAAVG